MVMDSGVIWGLHKRATDGQILYCPFGPNRAPQWIIPEEHIQKFIKRAQMSLLLYVMVAALFTPILRINYDTVGLAGAAGLILLVAGAYFATLFLNGNKYGKPTAPGSFPDWQVASATAKSRTVHRKILISSLAILAMLVLFLLVVRALQ